MYINLRRIFVLFQHIVSFVVKSTKFYYFGIILKYGATYYNQFVLYFLYMLKNIEIYLIYNITSIHNNKI